MTTLESRISPKGLVPRIGQRLRMAIHGCFEIATELAV